MAKRKSAFDIRLEKHLDELRELHTSIYNDEQAFDYFIGMLRRSYRARKASLRALDERREANPDKHHSNKMIGMMMYTEKFGGDLDGVRERLPYLKECGVKYLHLMPLLDSPDDERSDGGYAVSDFRKVRADLGTMEDLEQLASSCHRRGIRLCLDFVMNHTSEDHEWARAARRGDAEAQSRYFFYDNWSIPAHFEQTMPQVFPETAPGNFTFLKDTGKIVMTSFYPFQWDLNYANPMVFNDMTENMLYLANRGIDIVRLDAVPYIWKELGTNCRNRPQVHTLVRMMNLACRIVCPGVLLLGEVVMEPREVVPYFGTPEKPECDMLYNVTTMCSIWHTLATRDVKLLRHQMEILELLPDNCMFQNYIRCHDDIGWGLDYGYLAWFGTQEAPHKKYLNDWFTGKWPGSPSRGELYNESEVLRDARLCGTTASLCGIEYAAGAGDRAALELAVRADLMLHAWMLMLKGIPVIYSGDEIGMLNDNSYHDDPDKAEDSRNLHRGDFRWDLAEDRHDPDTLTGRIFGGIMDLISIRRENKVFHSDAQLSPVNLGDDRAIGVIRSYQGERMLGLFNFSEHDVRTEIETAAWKDMIDPDREFVPSGEKTAEYWLEPYGFRWFLEDKPQK